MLRCSKLFQTILSNRFETCCKNSKYKKTTGRVASWYLARPTGLLVSSMRLALWVHFAARSLIQNCSRQFCRTGSNPAEYIKQKNHPLGGFAVWRARQDYRPHPVVCPSGLSLRDFIQNCSRQFCRTGSRLAVRTANTKKPPQGWLLGIWRARQDYSSPP
ncbi:MAG: hypothetical protein ACI9R7_001344 [Lysobacterales bacterium]|jgi:hypothetical protein